MGTTLFLSVLFCILITSEAQNDPCGIGEKKGDAPFPMDAFKIGWSYEIEYITISPSSEVIYFESIYDGLQLAGKLTQRRKDETTVFTYFNTTNELIIQKDDTCFTEPLDRSNAFSNFPNKNDEWVLKLGGIQHFGPITMLFRAAFYDGISTPIIYKGVWGEIIRGKTARVWKQCMTPYLYSFHFDENNQPLRIDIEKNKKKVEVFNFYEFDAGNDVSIRVPVEAGCMRTNAEKVDLPPMVKGDVFLNGEIIYTDHIRPLDQKPKPFIIDFKIAYDDHSKTVALTHEQWLINRRDDNIAKLHPYRRVFTQDAGLYYSINLNTRQCTIQTTDVSPLNVELPDASYLVLNDRDILEGDGYTHQGTDMIDGVAVDVFERKIENYRLGDDRVWKYASITRMHYADVKKDNVEYKTLDPFKVVLKLYDGRGRMAREIVINIFNYLKRVPNKVKQFNIDACEKVLSPSQWFKMIFTPIQGYALKDKQLIDEIMSRDTDIELQFTNKLASQSQLHPSRVSKVLLDYTCDNLNIYGKILGRAPPILLFSQMDQQRIIGPSEYLPGNDENDCSDLCTDNGICKAFSFCGGNTCIISTSDDGGFTSENDTDCILYKFREDIGTELNSEALVRQFYNIFNFQLMFLKKLQDGKTDVISFEHNEDMTRNDLDKESFPNFIALAKGSSFQMTSEKNNRTEKNGNTVQFIEYYDFQEGLGKTVYTEGGQTKQMYFFVETNELFTVKPDQCFSQLLNESIPFGVYERDSFHEDLIYIDKSLSLIGPSALLYKAFEKSVRDAGSILYEGPGPAIRGIPSQVWVDCDDTEVVYKYYFSRSPNDVNLPSPLKITVESTPKANFKVSLVYEIFNFKTGVDETILRLPHGKGCERIDPDDVRFPQFPSLMFMDSDFFIRAEVVFDDRADGGKKMMSNFMIAKDSKSQLTSYSSTNWTIEKEEIFTTDLNRNIFGTNFETSIDESNGFCSIKEMDEPKVQINFPGDFAMNIDENVIFGGEGYSYIDEFIERDLQTQVFERVFTDYDVGSKIVYPKAVITRFFLSNKNKFIDDTGLDNIPLRTRLMLYRANNETKTFELDKVISFNFYEFKTNIINKAKIFNIESCMVDKESYNWFQIMYPFMNTEDFKNYILEEGSIAQTFITDILNTEIITPARISPQVEVDITKERLIITAKILDRTSPFYDYKNTEEVIISSVDETHSVMSEEECAQLCLKSGKCVVWSICNMACYLSYNLDVATNKEPICTTYALDKKTFVLGEQEITLSTALSKIRDLAVNGKLTIVLPALEDGTKFEPIKSASFSTDIPINQKSLEDDRFEVIEIGLKFDKTIEGASFVGDIFHDKCFEYCNAMDECVSLSMCRLDSACTLYSKHPADLKDPNIFVPSTDCVILEKKYSSSYNKFPGHSFIGEPKKNVKDQTLEQCAASCFKETSFNCLSFDHCKDKKDCSLYEEHVTKGKADEKLKKSDCNHYSRKFLYDFEAVRNKKVKEEEGVIEGVDLDACAKNCIENSGMACKAFDYCFRENGKGKCILSSKSEAKATLVSSSSCDHHYRKKSLASSSNYYSNGLAGGMAFLFIVFGVLLGIAAVFTYKNHIRNRS